MTKLPPAVLLCLAIPLSAYAQSTGGGSVLGSVTDISGAAMANVTIRILNPVSGYDRTVRTDNQGHFSFANLPSNNYHLAASAAGFQSADQDVNIRSAVPMEVKIVMKIGEAKTEVTVAGAGDLVETDSTSHTDVDRELFNK